jgi:hypothetical protein
LGQREKRSRRSIPLHESEVITLKTGSTVLQILKDVSCSYGMNFKLMFVRNAEADNCNVA